MNTKRSSPQTRRQFLKRAATGTAAVAAARLLSSNLSAQDRAGGVAIVLDPQDAIVTKRPVQWAAGQLRDALRNRGAAAEIFEDLEKVPATHECVLATSSASIIGRRALDGLGVSLPDAPEAIGLVRGNIGN